MTSLIAGIDLGGTAINYTLLDGAGRFLIGDLCEYPARVTDGPLSCLTQIAAGLETAVARAGVALEDVEAVGLSTPGPASAAGVLSAAGSTNFAHAAWANFDLRGAVAEILQRPVTYLNDGNAAAVWGHASLLGQDMRGTSVTVVIGTGLGGGVVVDGTVVTGARGFGAELGHVLLPWTRIPGVESLQPACNCGRIGDLESLCSLTAIRQSLLPHFLRQYPDHPFAHTARMDDAARMVRGFAQAGDGLGRDIFRVQAQALALFFDQMINVFDPDALVIGGGAIEASPDFQEWFVGEVRSALPPQRTEQRGIPIVIMPNGDTAGARGAALAARTAIPSASL